MHNGVISVILSIPLVTIPRLSAGIMAAEGQEQGGRVESRYCRRGDKRKQIRMEGKTLYGVKERWRDWEGAKKRIREMGREKMKP